jgi:hypothetical protein
MSEPNLEPTGDDVPDGTQLPDETGEDDSDTEVDAGVGDAEIEYDEDVFAEGDS